MSKCTYIINKIIVFTLFSILLHSCVKSELDYKIEGNTELKDFNFEKKTPYDLALEKLAFGINKGLKNDEFRSLIRTSVEEGFTHDYDVPVSHFKSKAMLKSAGGMDVSLFLESLIYPEKAKYFKSSGYITFLDSLAEAFPDLLFSIPVNVELIDEGVVPYVLFIPEEFEDVTYTSIRAINPNGEIEYLGLMKEPDFPVVVIKRMEGGNEIDEELERQNTNVIPKSSNTVLVHDDINFNAQTHNAGVKLSWTKCPDALEYKLYRYRHIVQLGTDTEGYEYITAFTNLNNNSFVDEKTYSTMPRNVYFERYKMEVTYADNYSAVYYTYPKEKLSDIKIGDIDSKGNKIIEVNWTILDTTNVLVGLNVYRSSSVTSDGTNPNNVWDNGWLLCNPQILAPHLTSYKDYDAQKIPGKAYFYRVLPRSYSTEQNWNFQASSNAEAAKYVNLGICSDRSDNAQLIATHMKTRDISQLEGWIYGKPEFKFAVFGYNTLDSLYNAGNPKRLGEFSINKDYKRKSYNSGIAMNKVMLLKWSNDLNYEIIAVVGYEHDDNVGGLDAIAMKLKTLAIDLIQRTVQTKTGIDISGLSDVLKSQAGDTYAGGAYIIRSGKENVTLKLDQGSGGKNQKQLPAGGVMFRISSTTNTSAWSPTWDNDIVQLADDKY